MSRKIDFMQWCLAQRDAAEMHLSAIETGKMRFYRDHADVSDPYVTQLEGVIANLHKLIESTGSACPPAARAFHNRSA